MDFLVAVVLAAGQFFGPGPEQEVRLSQARIWQSLPLETREGITAQSRRERSVS